MLQFLILHRPAPHYIYLKIEKSHFVRFSTRSVVMGSPLLHTHLTKKTVLTPTGDPLDDTILACPPSQSAPLA